MATKGRRKNVCLPEDVMVEILSRLSVKDLLRFKCVCTQWRRLISSSSFTTLHLNRSISNPTRHCILVHDYSENKLTTFDPDTFSPIGKFHVGLYQSNSSPWTMIILGSINGLLCMSDYEFSDNWLWLGNPSTRMFKRIPTSSRKKPFISVGFGFDAIANDYKVVRIGCEYRQGEMRTWAEVWSANLESWREIRVNYSFCPLWYVCDVIAGGLAHWIVEDEANIIQVASFDLRTEVLRVIQLPKVLTGHDYTFSGLNWKERFALAACDTVWPWKIYQVWTIENDSFGKELWSKKFSFELDVGFCSFVNTLNGKVVVVNGGKLVLYDLETREMQTVGTPEKYWAWRIGGLPTMWRA